MFAIMLPEAIAADWERIGDLLAPAIAEDDQRQPADVYRDLMSGDFVLFEVDLQGAKGVIVVEIASPCFWLIYVAGRISGPKSHWLGRVKALTLYFSVLAKANNCTEMRLEGRNWAPIFPDWERLGTRNALRKAL